MAITECLPDAACSPRAAPRASLEAATPQRGQRACQSELSEVRGGEKVRRKRTHSCWPCWPCWPCACQKHAMLRASSIQSWGWEWGRTKTLEKDSSETEENVRPNETVRVLRAAGGRTYFLRWAPSGLLAVPNSKSDSWSASSWFLERACEMMKVFVTSCKSRQKTSKLLTSLRKCRSVSPPWRCPQWP